MKNTIAKYWKLLLSLLFAIAVFLFWMHPYAFVLSYQEQYQLFLFDENYFLERMSLPGGFVDYLAEFLTQFYFLYVVGAAILAILFLLFQRATWQLFHKFGAKEESYPLSFIPAILLWFYMGDENVMLSFLLSLILAEYFAMLYIAIADACKGWIGKTTCVIVGLPLLYWLIGANVEVVAALILLYELKSKKHPIVGLAAPLVVVAVVLIGAQFQQYPLYRLFGGINYYRYPAYVPYMQIGVMAVASILPLIISMLPDTKNKFIVPCEVLFLTVGGFFFVKAGFDPLKYDIIEYDALVRSNSWDKIIEKAEKNQPQTPLEVSCVNLALSQKGQLCDRIFEFYQNGGEGLFPTFTRDMVSPVSTAEVFFNLGMVNDAERYMFEAQEAIPNFRKSGRLTMRIIQCEIVNGQYAVARKYLKKLQKSLFYRKWAEEQMNYINQPKLIASDPLYAKLRKYRYTKDILFSDREMDQILGLLFIHCNENRNAFEYLMAYEMLQRDMEKFMKYYPIGKFAGYTDHIPYALQQALLYSWTQTHNSLQGMPWSIDSQWANNMVTFIQTYMRNKEDETLKTGPLSKTFWSYMLINKDSGKKTGRSMKQIY